MYIWKKGRVVYSCMTPELFSVAVPLEDLLELFPLNQHAKYINICNHFTLYGAEILSTWYSLLWSCLCLLDFRNSDLTPFQLCASCGFVPHFLRHIILFVLTPVIQVLSGKTGSLWAFTSSSIRKPVDPVLNGAEGLATNGIEKGEVHDVFFALVFTHKTSIQDSQAPKTRRQLWSNEYLHG